MFSHWLAVFFSLEPSELAIHFAVVRHLRHRARPGVFWCHFPAGEIRDAATASKLKAMGTKPGVPDFVLLIGGQLHGLELKRHDGRLSPDQRATIVELEAAGGICHVAYSVDEALTVLIAWGGLHADAGKIHRQPERIMAHDEQASPPPTSRLSACCHWR